MFCSYSSFKALENGRFSAKELKVVLKKGSKTLPHIRVYKEIIRRDFRNQFKFFNQNIALQTRVADTLLQQIKNSGSCGGNHFFKAPMGLHAIDTTSGCALLTSQKILQKTNQDENKHRLYQTFKIKALGVGSNHNFLSDKSLTKICQRSKNSLEDLALKNAVYLTNSCLVENLSSLQRLIRLDLSYTKQIDDSVIKIVAVQFRNLKKLSLRFLNEITSESVSLVLEHQKLLEGLDLSGCFKINLDTLMIKFRDNKQLTCVLLEYLFLQPYHLSHLRYTRIHTLSTFCNQRFKVTSHYSNLDSRTVGPSHLDVLKQVSNLTNLNVKECPNVTEQGKDIIFNDFYSHSYAYRSRRNDRGERGLTVQGCSYFLDAYE